MNGWKIATATLAALLAFEFWRSTELESERTRVSWSLGSCDDRLSRVCKVLSTCDEHCDGTEEYEGPACSNY